MTPDAPVLEAKARAVRGGRDVIAHRPATIKRQFRSDALAPALARTAVDGLSHSLEPACLEDTRLIVSELVSNAVEHGSITADAVVTLRLYLSPSLVIGAVEDEGAGVTAPPQVPHDDGVRGWGLHLVHELADRSGFELGPPSAVWFEIDRIRAPALLG